MWNHTYNCSTSGDDDTNEADPNLWLKDRIERSLDLSQYLKYLDELFGEASSESESSESEDGEGSRTFTFRHPPAATQTGQTQERPQFAQGHNSLFLGASTVSEYSNHVSSFAALKHTDAFQIESNISSSSLSSIDSGTSSLNLSSESYLDASQSQTENNVNGVTKSIENNRTDDESDGKKDKKAQKKKKTGRSSGESFSRQHKPSSGGTGNSGSKGGGGSAGGPAPGGSSNDNSGGSSGSSSNQSLSGNSSGSPGAKSRSGQPSLGQLSDSHDGIISAADVTSKYNNNNNNNIVDCNESANADLQRALGIRDSSIRSLLLQEDLVDSFETEDSFSSSFPLLDNIPDEENSLSDFISMSTTLQSTNASPSSTSQCSTNFFSKIAEAAAASAIGNTSLNIANRSSLNPSTKDKMETKKRKLDAKIREQPCKVSKLTEKQKQSRIDYLNAKRRKIYVYISRKDVVKTQRTRVSIFKEGLAIKRKLALACARQVQKNALQSQKSMKESVCKAKRLTQEMEAYWRSVEKSERDLQRKVERESREKTRRDTPVRSKFQNEKLGYLITQIELFVNKLLNKNIIEVNEDDLIKYFEVVKVDDERLNFKLNSEILKSSVHSTIDRAVNEHHSLVRLLDMSGVFMPSQPNATETVFYKLADGILKPFQVFGIKWIEELYNKGLNGILADESGLGKKVQVTAFLSHLAKSYSLWGPFLIVTPLNSVGRWQQELSRMCSKFKVILYFGKPLERKILRQGWEKNRVHTEDAGFHVVVTSYQIMAADLKYFSKTKWQYLVMDDPQGIITSSSKWMALLSFRCRNKLLLCGNPRLDSLPNICSYLYFIIPSLFDSQKELSEWLLTELEYPTNRNISLRTENESKILDRLKIVVHNFFLRREMRDIKVETTPGIFLQLNCSLSKRQRQIYDDVLKRADLEKNIRNIETCQPEDVQIKIKNVLDLTIQLGKLCNHPNLIEEWINWSPYLMKPSTMPLPSLLGQLLNIFERHRILLGGLFCIFSSLNVHNSLYEKSHTRESSCSTWSFSRLLSLSCNEVEKLYTGGIATRLNYLVNCHSVLERQSILHVESSGVEAKFPAEFLFYSLRTSKVLSSLLFTTNCSWRKYAHWPCWNSIEYRALKTRKYFQENKVYQNYQSIGAPISYLKNFEYPDVLQCYSSAVYSEGFKPCVSTECINLEMMENRLSISEFENLIQSNRSLNKKVVAEIKHYLSLAPSHRFLNDHEAFIGASGKMMMLDKLLYSLKVQNHRILLVSFLEENLLLLEKYLKMRSFKYARVENDTSIDHRQIPDQNFIVYLMLADVSIDLKTTIDSVIFFDHDWSTNWEQQKTKIMHTLGYPISVDCFGLVCAGSIEERMQTLTKDRNIVSLALSKKVFGSKPPSSVRALKSLVSILMREPSYDSALTNESCSMTCSNHFNESLPGTPTKENVNAQDSIALTKQKVGSNTTYCHGEGVFRIQYAKNDEDLESTSPSCSEERDVYLDDETCGNTDIERNFSLSFDEGYMGMSPDSLEYITIKSGYEEHVSSKKIKIGRGSGKRGRPPSRVRVIRKNTGNDESETIRRGPGRPRLKTMGPSNQGTRGRKPGRPPLTKKAETISSGLATLSSGQNVFGFYNSSELELS